MAISNVVQPRQNTNNQGILGLVNPLLHGIGSAAQGVGDLGASLFRNPAPPVPANSAPQIGPSSASALGLPKTTKAPVTGLIKPPSSSLATTTVPTLTQAELTAQNGGIPNLPQNPSQNNNGSVQPPVTPQTPFQSAVGGLLQSPTQNAAIGSNAQQIAANYGKQIADIGKIGAGQAAGDLTTGTQAIGEGNAAIAANAASARMNALGTAENAALAGTGQQLTAQNQAQSGLNQAGGLAAPQLGSIGQVPFSPTDLSQGSPLGAPGGTAADAAKVAGQFQGAQAAAAAPGQTQAANIQTGGTAATSAAASGLQSATQNYVAANTAYSTATNQAGNLQQTMTATGINTNPQFINSKINSLQNQLGSTNYTAFITALSEAQQAYTSLLSSVGAATPTVNGQQATAIFSPNSTPAQINAAIDALNQAAYAKLKPMYDQIGTYASQLGGNSNAGNSSGTNYNF